MQDCGICKSQFGFEIIDDESNVDTTVKLEKLKNKNKNSQIYTKSCVEKNVSASINKIKFVKRIPYKINCSSGHYICNLCALSIGNNSKNIPSRLLNGCPICNPNIDAKPVSIQPDSELLLIAFNRNDKTPFEIEYLLNEEYLKLYNRTNIKDVRANLQKFIMRCCYCNQNESSLKNQNDFEDMNCINESLSKNVNLYADVFCYTCLTLCCKFCIDHDHENHHTSPLRAIDFDTIPCPDHNRSSANLFCIEDSKFICSDCAIKDNHKRHDYLEFYEESEIQKLKVEFTNKFSKIRTTCEKYLVSQKTEISKLVSNNIPQSNSLLDIEYTDYEAVRSLFSKKFELTQSINIIETVMKELKFMFENINLKLISLNTIDKKKSLEKVLNGYILTASIPLGNFSEKKQDNSLLNQLNRTILKSYSQDEIDQNNNLLIPNKNVITKTTSNFYYDKINNNNYNNDNYNDNKINKSNQNKTRDSINILVAEDDSCNNQKQVKSPSLSPISYSPEVNQTYRNYSTSSRRGLNLSYKNGRINTNRYKNNLPRQENNSSNFNGKYKSKETKDNYNNKIDLNDEPKVSNSSSNSDLNINNTCSTPTMPPSSNINNNLDNGEADLFTKQEFEFGKNMKAKIIKIDKPTLFWVIPETRFKLLDKINYTIAAWLQINNGDFTNEEISALSEGDLVAFVDRAYYARGKILEIEKVDEQLEFNIFGIDSGVMCKLKSNQIKKLPLDVIKIPDLTIKCFLTNLRPIDFKKEEEEAIINSTDTFYKHKYTWSFNSLKLMKDWICIYKNKLRLKILNKVESFEIYEVDLYHELSEDLNKLHNFSTLVQKYNIGSVSLGETLIKFKIAEPELIEDNTFKSFFKKKIDKPRFVPMQSFYPDQNVNAIVCHFDSLKSFHCKKIYPDDEYDTSFYNLTKKLNEDYKESNILRIFDPEIGMPVAALYKDNSWYRAEIAKIYSAEELKFDVMFVDYGEICTVPITNVRYLKKDYLCDEVCTFKCKLFGIDFKTKENYDAALQFVFNSIEEILNSDKKIVNVHVKNIIQDTKSKLTINREMNEIILRFHIDGKLTNINVLLTKIGLAECTNISIYDGEKEESRINIKEKHVIKKKPTPTDLEKITKEIKEMPNKVINTKPENSILCKVTNAVSPSEIWVQDIVDTNNLFEQFQNTLIEKYNKLLQQQEFITNSKQIVWQVDDYCVMKKSKQHEFYRAKILKKESNGKFKVICLDNGLYETCEAQNLYELVEEFNDKPKYKAKKCFLIGVLPTGTTNGKWSSLAETFTNESLNDKLVQVVFNSEKKSNDVYEVCIYVDAKQKQSNLNPDNKEPVFGDNEFIRFADILNNRGLALLIEKKHALLSNSEPIQSTSLLISDDSFISVKYSDLPKKIYKNYQNNQDAYYESLVTWFEPDIENGELFVYVHLLKLTQASKILKEMRIDLESSFKLLKYSEDLDLRFDLNFLLANIKQEKQLACTVQIDRKFYRGEILNETSNEDFMVRLVDYGRILQVNYSSIYRPLIKYSDIERQAFKIKINSKFPEIDPVTLQNITNETRALILNKLVKLKVDTILNLEDQEDLQGLTVIGDILIESLGLHLSDFFKSRQNGLFINSILNETIEEIPSLVVPFSFNRLLFNVIPSWIEGVDKIWLQFTFNDNETFSENENNPPEIKVINQNFKEFKKMQNEFLQLNMTQSLQKVQLYEIEENKTYCCFFKQDQNFYRAKTLSVDYINETAHVRYIDFGNEEQINFEHIYHLDNKYKVLPEQTFICKLKNIKVPKDVQNDSIKLNNLINELHDELLFLPDEVNIWAKFFLDFEKQQPEVELYFNKPLENKSNLAYKKLLDKNLLALSN